MTSHRDLLNTRPRSRVPTALRRLGAIALILTLIVFFARPALAQQPVAPVSVNVKVNEIAPHFYLLTDGTVNFLLFAGQQVSVSAGIHKPALVARANSLVKEIGAAPIKYDLLTEDVESLGYGDGGAKRAGAITFAHERLTNRLIARAEHSGRSTSTAHHAEISGSSSAPDLPSLGFSAVVQLWLPDEEIHFIHERNGYSDADVIVHIEHAGILYLGSTFTTDGYPSIDLEAGGTVHGLMDAAEYFIRTFGNTPERVEPIIPGRGAVATVADLRAYADMLSAIVHRIESMITRHIALTDIIATRPTLEFDERWGHGAVRPEDFVRMVYASLLRDAAKQ